MEASFVDPQSGTVASQAETNTSTRINYLDSLRSIALLLGILLHVGIGFSEMLKNIWPGSSTQTSWYFDYWIWIVHTFRMPLFFLIAGFFALFLIDKRKLKGFVKNRALRIVLPFILFVPVVTASVMGIIFYAAMHLDATNPILELFRNAIANPEVVDGKKPPFSFFHLWFLYYLIIFCVAFAFLQSYIQKTSKLVAWFSHPLSVLIILPCISFFLLLNTGIPHPAPDKLIPEAWAIGFYGLFFLMGAVIFRAQNWLEKITPYWPLLTVSSIVSIVLLLANLPEPVPLITDPEQAAEVFKIKMDLKHILGVAATATLAWHLSALSLIAAKRFLDSESRIIRFISDGSYWAYIVHLPLVLYLQLQFATVPMATLLKFLVISSLTFAGCYLSYAILVRYTPIGWLLNGRKKRGLAN